MSEIVVRPIRSSLISLKRGARAFFLLGARFYTDKIILLYNSRDAKFLRLRLRTYREAFHFSSCVFAKFHTMQLSAVWGFNLLMKYRHSFATEPLCSPRNKSTALSQASLKTQSYHGEITANTVQL